RWTRVAQSARKAGEIGAAGDISVRPYPHVLGPRRAPAGPSGVGPDLGHTGHRRFGLPAVALAKAGIRRDRIGLGASILQCSRGPTPARALQNGLDEVRSTLRVHEHPAIVLPLDPVERGEDL